MGQSGSQETRDRLSNADQPHPIRSCSLIMKLTAKHRERFRKIAHQFKGNAVGFRADEIRLPDGRARNREYLTHPGAVGVLAFASPSKILLVKQFRYPVGKFTYEIPAGKLSKGEDPLAC